MKKRVCECTGCHKTATRRLRNDHWICEDCAKELRRAKKAKKIRYFLKEVLIGHAGPFSVYTDVPVKL